MNKKTSHNSCSYPTKALVLCGVLMAFSSIAGATYIAETEPNDSFATAQSLDGSFSLDADGDIGDFSANTSTSLPHASVRGTGDRTLDYYSFTVANPNTLVILDIDYGAPDLDSALWLWHESDLVNEVRNDWDTDATAGASGSVPNTTGVISEDSFIQQIVAEAGLYYALVGAQGGPGTPGYIAVPQDTSYILHVSVDQPIDDSEIPVPASLALIALGLPALRLFRKS